MVSHICFFTFLSHFSFFFWFQIMSPCTWVKCGWPGPALPGLLSLYKVQILRTKNLICLWIQNFHSKAQWLVSQGELWRQLPGKEIKSREKWSTPGLWGHTWDDPWKPFFLPLYFLSTSCYYPRIPSMLLSQGFCICCSLCLEISSQRYFKRLVSWFIRLLLKWSGLSWLPYLKLKLLYYSFCHYSVLFFLRVL